MRRPPVALAAAILLALALFVYLAFPGRNSVQALLADWTGEEDFQHQLKGLGYLALSLVQPPHETADLAPMRYADVNPFGVNTFLEQEVEEVKIRQAFQMVREAGFQWIRQVFPWEDIEQPGKGQYWDGKYSQSTWDKYDRIVAFAQEYGIEIIARLDHPPAWTRAKGRELGDAAPPDNYEDYGDFVATVVSRYRGKIRFYQLWNEPNVYPEWGEQPVSAPDYVRLLKIGYTRAKQADPSVVILSAGLAQTTELGPTNLSDLVFLQQMYDAGARGFFDILAVQDYGLWTGPGDRRVEAERTNFSRPILIREIMVKNGDANIPIWAMEVGWNALPAGMEAPFGRVSEQQQARYAVQAYARAQNEWPWMGAMMYWFFKRATDRETSQPMYYFRLVDPDFTPRPAYGALKDHIARARVVAPGFRSTSHWAVDWTGGWETRADDRAYFGEYRIGQTGASASFVFRGTDLDLVALQNPYGGTVHVQVDGETTRELELWRTDAGVGGRIPVARDLQDGEHRVSLTVARGPVALNGFIIQRRNAWMMQRIALLAGLVAVVSGGVVLAGARARRPAANPN